MSEEGVALRIPPKRRAAGRYELSFEVRSPLDDGVAKTLGVLTKLFVTAGNQGAFPAPGMAPSAAHLEVRNAWVDASSRRVVYEFEGDAFDLFGFELLRNMADRLGRDGTDIDNIVVSVPGADRESRLKPEPNEDTEYDAYPGMSPLVGFQRLREPLDDRRLRRCLVELTTRVQGSHVVRMSQWVAPWFQLLEAGAFALPVGHAWETDSFAGDATIFDEQSMEISVNRFQASECAWHALLNMLDTCWPEARLISTVVID